MSSLPDIVERLQEIGALRASDSAALALRQLQEAAADSPPGLPRLGRALRALVATKEVAACRVLAQRLQEFMVKQLTADGLPIHEACAVAFEDDDDHFLRSRLCNTAYQMGPARPKAPRVAKRRKCGVAQAGETRELRAHEFVSLTVAPGEELQLPSNAAQLAFALEYTKARQLRAPLFLLPEHIETRGASSML